MDSLKRLWHNVVNFAPWKVIFLTWLIQIVISIVGCTAICVATGWVVPGFLTFLVNVGIYYFFFPKVYRWVYPHGWRGGFLQ